MVITGVTSVGAEPVALSGRAMGTVWSVKFFPTEPALTPADLEREVAAKLEQLEAMFSTYREQSDLSRFNAARSTEWIRVPAELAQVAAESRRISELTGGAFDATVQPLVALWGFGPIRRTGPLPTSADVSAARARVGWRQLDAQATPPALRKARADVSADFSSLAKGFAADAVSAWLTRRHVTNHLVQVGGDIRSGGRGGDGTGWPTAIEEPTDGAPGIAVVLRLTGQALSTSGDTRNFFQHGGRRYGHIIDPRTGEPTNHGLAAVSVVHASCATSSALATGLFVLGPEDGFRLAAEQKIPALFLAREGAALSRRATREFERLVQTTNTPPQ